MLGLKRHFCLILIRGVIFICLNLVFLLISFLTTPVFAGEASYIYDDLGRLSKVVSKTGDVAVYNYDAVGNLLSIERQTTSQGLPILHSISPDIIFTGAFGTTVSVTITGENLLTTEAVTSDNAGISISNVFATDTTITAMLTISPDAFMGRTNITVTTLYGSASIPVTLARLTLSPVQAAVTTGSTIDITAGIAGVAQDLTITLNNKNPDIIEAPQSIAILAGGTAAFTVRTLKEGTGVITAGNAGISIYVTQPFTGDASISSPSVSVSIGIIPSGTLVNSRHVSVQMPFDTLGVSVPVNVKINTQ